MSNQSSKQLVLIYGESNHGKTTLGNQLEGHYGYQVIRLDKVYVKFIKTKYPEFDVPDLYRVIGQHYGLILARLDAEGSAAEGATLAWLNQVSHEIDAALKESDLVAVEGYLLLPILLAIQERFTGKAIIKTYEARNRQYFMSSTIEKIAVM